MPHPLCDQFNIPWKVSPWNASFLPIHVSFLHRKVPLYSRLLQNLSVPWYSAKNGIWLYCGTSWLVHVNKLGHEYLYTIVLKSSKFDIAMVLSICLCHNFLFYCIYRQMYMLIQPTINLTFPLEQFQKLCLMQQGRVFRMNAQRKHR